MNPNSEPETKVLRGGDVFGEEVLVAPGVARMTVEALSDEARVLVLSKERLAKVRRTYLNPEP